MTSIFLLFVELLNDVYIIDITNFIVNSFLVQTS